MIGSWALLIAFGPFFCVVWGPNSHHFANLYLQTPVQFVFGYDLFLVRDENIHPDRKYMGVSRYSISPTLSGKPRVCRDEELCGWLGALVRGNACSQDPNIHTVHRPDHSGIDMGKMR